MKDLAPQAHPRRRSLLAAALATGLLAACSEGKDSAPAFAGIDITGAEMNPSLRTIYGVETVAAGLTELGLAEPGPVGAPDPAN